jgi:hypothetical protein
MPRLSTYRLPMLTEREWSAIAKQIPRPKAGPPPRNDREILAAVCYAQAAGCSYESLPPGYPKAMSIRTRVQRWQRVGALRAILEAAGPAIERMSVNYNNRLRELSYGPGWRFDRKADDPDYIHLPRLTHRM